MLRHCQVKAAKNVSWPEVEISRRNSLWYDKRELIAVLSFAKDQRTVSATPHFTPTSKIREWHFRAEVRAGIISPESHVFTGFYKPRCFVH